MEDALNDSEPHSAKIRPPIDMGWILSSGLEAPDLEGAHRAIDRVLETLRGWFPDFEWRGLCLDRHELPGGRAQPVTLLDVASHERELRRWDFAFLVTEGDLHTFYKPFAFAASSRSIATAVLSTARIDPHATQRDVEREERIEWMATRLHALFIHVFTHLNGLGHAADPKDYLYDFNGIDELDRLERFDPERREKLRHILAEVADLRLEEKVDQSRPGLFYLRAAWIGRAAILRAVLEARPWQFPIRLSRLTTAATSALFLIWITAEAWELGLSRSPALAILFSLTALFLTTGYVLVQQRLLASRGPRRLSEQQVVTRCTITLVVMLGLFCTYVLLFVLNLLMSQLLFDEQLLESWSPSLEGELRSEHLLIFSGFTAALGILIGSLGASFEDNVTIRHIAYVDEET